MQAKKSKDQPIVGKVIKQTRKRIRKNNQHAKKFLKGKKIAQPSTGRPWKNDNICIGHLGFYTSQAQLKSHLLQFYNRQERKVQQILNIESDKQSDNLQNIKYFIDQNIEKVSNDDNIELRIYLFRLKNSYLNLQIGLKFGHNSILTLFQFDNRKHIQQLKEFAENVKEMMVQQSESLDDLCGNHIDQIQLITRNVQNGLVPITLFTSSILFFISSNVNIEMFKIFYQVSQSILNEFLSRDLDIITFEEFSQSLSQKIYAELKDHQEYIRIQKENLTMEQYHEDKKRIRGNKEKSDYEPPEEDEWANLMKKSKDGSFDEEQLKNYLCKQHIYLEQILCQFLNMIATHYLPFKIKNNNNNNQK